MDRRTRPFTLSVPEDDVADLKTRLSRTRLPDQAPGGTWAYGTDLSYMRELIDYWGTGFDWRAQVSKLNAYAQFKAALDDIDLHFLHVPGKGPDPKPLLVLHGWPGSVFEMLELIPRLTDPARFGGNPDDAFTVVVPSLPGYGLSFEPGQMRFGIPDIADCMARLMTEVLGYEKFAAHGGDWGSFICSSLGIRHPEKIAGIHICLLSVRYDRPLPGEPTREELRYADEVKTWAKEDGGYIAIQGTRPQTLA